VDRGSGGQGLWWTAVVVDRVVVDRGGDGQGWWWTGVGWWTGVVGDRGGGGQGLWWTGVVVDRGGGGQGWWWTEVGMKMKKRGTGNNCRRGVTHILVVMGAKACRIYTSRWVEGVQGDQTPPPCRFPLWWRYVHI
jgi:hypothetical protein